MSCTNNTILAGSTLSLLIQLTLVILKPYHVKEQVLALNMHPATAAILYLPALPYTRALHVFKTSRLHSIHSLSIYLRHVHLPFVGRTPASALSNLFSGRSKSTGCY